MQLEDKYYEWTVKNERRRRVHSATEMAQIIDVIEWTCQASSEKSLDYLSPCLLSPEIDPYTALCFWVGHITGCDYREHPTVITSFIENPETLQTLNQPDGPNNDSNILRRDVDDNFQRHSQNDVSLALLVQACHQSADSEKLNEFEKRLSSAILWLKHRSVSSDETQWLHLSYLARVLHPKLYNSEPSARMTGAIDFLSYVLESFVDRPRLDGVGELISVNHQSVRV